MSNFSYSQPQGSSNPWTLSVKNRVKQKNDNCDISDFQSAKDIFAAKIKNKPYFNSNNISSSQSTQSDDSNDNQIFINARKQILEEKLKNKPYFQPNESSASQSTTQNYHGPSTTVKRLGLTAPFVNPMRRNDDQSNNNPSFINNFMNNPETVSTDSIEVLNDPRAKSLDKNIVDKILNEIIDKKSSITWDDIGGLGSIKEELEEIVILPMKRPDLFVGLLSPCKGLLLFGPPGTGKTLIGKCIASQSNSTFFSISASSLTSKWIGEGEKLVRTLFTIARIKQPSVIFIDEIDSLLTQRSDSEHESSRRLKTEFLVQFDGLSTEKHENLLVIGATNRPQELDEAARRRFTKRLYIPLPNLKARKEIIDILIEKEHNLNEKSLIKLCRMTQGYSGADLSSLCKDAALNIIRRFGKSRIMDIKDKAELPPLAIDDFLNAIKRVKASVSKDDLEIYKKWNATFGAIPFTDNDEDEFENNEINSDLNKPTVSYFSRNSEKFIVLRFKSLKIIRKIKSLVVNFDLEKFQIFNHFKSREVKLNEVKFNEVKLSGVKFSGILTKIRQNLMFFTPLYTLHFKSRLFHNFNYSDIFFDSLRETDESEYRCRIDYKQSRTRNYVIKLNVIAIRVYFSGKHFRKHKPIVKLKLGASLHADRLREGSDLYLDCVTDSNPPVNSVRFLKDGQLVQPETGVLISNQTLVLQQVRRRFRGLYTCEASNSVGKSQSDSLFLRIQHFVSVEYKSIPWENEDSFKRFETDGSNVYQPSIGVITYELDNGLSNIRALNTSNRELLLDPSRELILEPNRELILETKLELD
ncbi:hypothetical protein RND71_043328 [Anisodus tanguticus]|uniref:Ig-like domain-containing protein n=1 Tax=Anisodus tanguticus TaxID=243964 RepID=A0AAE1QPH6_9SOLA|nr:hypothetical protein RND71_043328 [Anisodus tanguticus]